MKFDQDLCLNLQYDFGKMNSTLGSVVPLAMFGLWNYYVAKRKTSNTFNPQKQKNDEKGSCDQDLGLLASLAARPDLCFHIGAVL